ERDKPQKNGYGLHVQPVLDKGPLGSESRGGGLWGRSRQGGAGPDSTWYRGRPPGLSAGFAPAFRAVLGLDRLLGVGFDRRTPAQAPPEPGRGIADGPQFGPG